MKRDKRIIDLRRPIPEYVPWPDEPLQLTLCAGDGMQRANNKLITDIEYFTSGIEGYNREYKPTNIFCCSPTYNLSGIEKNIGYMADNKELKILLVLCDTTNDQQLKNFKLLFKNKLQVIQEDIACYGATLSNTILHDVLVPGGYYMLDDYQKKRGYVKDTARFSYSEPEFNKLIITKQLNNVEQSNNGEQDIAPPKSLKRARGGKKTKGRRRKTVKN